MRRIDYLPAPGFRVVLRRNLYLRYCSEFRQVIMCYNAYVFPNEVIYRQLSHFRLLLRMPSSTAAVKPRLRHTCISISFSPKQQGVARKAFLRNVAKLAAASLLGGY